MDAAEPRYIADCMLGRLARWLRALGYDVAYDRRISDAALIARGLAEGRIVLTRDRRLVQRRALRGPTASILIESGRPEDQLVEMARRHGVTLRPDRLLTRCLVCNDPTVPAAKESVRDLVPPYVFSTQTAFSRCPGCGRIYWRATHVDSLVRRLEARLGGGPLA